MRCKASRNRFRWLPVGAGTRPNTGPALVGAGPRTRPPEQIFRSAVVVILLCYLFLAPAAAKELRLEEIFAEHGLTGPQPTQLQWTPDGNLLSYILENPQGERDLWAVDPTSGEKRILVSYEELQKLAPATERATQDERERERRRRYSVAAYVWSPDSKSILFTSAGQLYLYDLKAKRAKTLAPEKKGVRDPKFSPNGRWVSFIHEHDIWVALTNGEKARRLTHGATETLFYGDLDWVYPEEFGVRSGYFWSPDSRRIAFLELDQSNVPTYPIPDLLSIQSSVDMQRYPKPGDPNPRVRVGIVAAKPRARKMPRVTWVDRKAEYIPRFSWVNDGLVTLHFMNRAQTELELVFADAANGRARQVLVEKDPYWINITNDLTFLKDREQFLWTSERSGFRHIYLYGYGGRLEKALTEGEWEVERIVRFDSENGWVYYSSNEENSLGNDLFRVKLDGGKKEKLTNTEGTHRISMNPKAAAYANRFSALMRPPELSVRHLPSGKETAVHQSHSLKDYNLIEPEVIEIQAPDEALIRIMLLKPDKIEPGQKLPLLAYVYGGPHAPAIRDAWGSRGRFLFHQYLARKGFVVAYIDDRASSIRGHRYEAALRNNYGPLAVRDYETAVKHLKTLGFVDPNRIGIWGWSGGGFSTCMALTHSKLFKAGIAVAPVTDWRFYDSIYTERYMGLPEQQPEAYRKTSAVRAAKNLHGRLLLVHPTSDDNVHIQNTIQMIDALIEAGKAYDLLLYPGKTHSIYGQKERLHLFRSMEEYLDRHLK